MSRRLQFAESPLEQRVGEKLAYTVDTSPEPYGGSPSAVSVTLEEQSGATWVDVSSTRLDSTHDVAGDVITTPRVSVLAGKTYRLTVAFTSAGQDWRPYLELRGKD